MACHANNGHGGSGHRHCDLDADVDASFSRAITEDPATSDFPGQCTAM
jgi:hypothetical protein